MREGPEELFVQGSLEALKLPCISIIGSRKISPYGEQVANLLIPGLVKSGLTIVSGLAYGIDSLAHKIALRHGGKCVAVLGSGLDRIYPAIHASLYRTIIEAGGCALSEYPPGTTPQKYYFPARNRIVAALSGATLIIEAGEKSGTLITARCALDEGRDVLVVPGDITRESSAGITSLLKQGAHPVASVEDVLSFYAMYPLLSVASDLLPALTGSPATLYDLISHGHDLTDQLVQRTGWSIGKVQSVLSVLELDGYIYFKGNKWLRTSL
jgi:DNA processing protein